MAAGEILEKGLRRRVRWIEGRGRERRKERLKKGNKERYHKR